MTLTGDLAEFEVAGTFLQLKDVTLGSRIRDNQGGEWEVVDRLQTEPIFILRKFRGNEKLVIQIHHTHGPIRFDFTPVGMIKPLAAFVGALELLVQG